MKGSERSRKGMKELPGYSNAVGIMGISKGCDGIWIIDNFWESGFSGVLGEKTTLEGIKRWLIDKQLEASAGYFVTTHRSTIETSDHINVVFYHTIIWNSPFIISHITGLHFVSINLFELRQAILTTSTFLPKFTPNTNESEIRKKWCTSERKNIQLPFNGHLKCFH